MIRACPICEKRSTRMILEQPYLDRNIVQCLRCGLYYADHVPDDDYYEFGLHQLRAPGDKKPSYAKDVVDRMDVDAKTSVLDVGCGTGDILEELRKLGCTNLVGVEPCHWKREAAQARGFNVYSSLDYVHERFDVVCAIHVIEHILYPRDFLYQMMRLSTAEIYIETPRVRCWMANDSDYMPEEVIPFGHFTREHIQWFSNVDLQNLCRIRAEVECVQKPVSSWCVRYILGSEVESYLNISLSLANRHAEQIWEAAMVHGEVALWGASEHTKRLQHHTKLPTHHLIDNDPGLNALPPSWLEARPDITIVVSSYAHQNSILAEIKRRNLPNPVVVLYDKPVE
jgi:SAM-dependent methyltransferase